MEAKFELTNLLTPIINTIKTVNSELSHAVDEGVSEYLHAQLHKYYYTNTFLHRSEKVKFKDVYYPLNTTHNLLTTNFNDVNEVFSEYKNITIVGSAGSGKTTVLRHIFFQFIDKFSSSKRIPVIIELRHLNDYKNSFENYIAEKLLSLSVKPSLTTLKRSLKAGRFVFLLDGYDEIASTRKQAIIHQIEQFVDAYTENYFLITTRPGAGVENIPRFYKFHMNPLDETDITNFVDKMINNIERKTRINNTISDPKNELYIEYLSNPLLLSMFILAFETHPEIPSKKSAFYKNVFDTLYSKHDGITKNSFPREKKTNLKREDFESILELFSYITITEGRYSYTEEYLIEIFKKIKEAKKYSFESEDLIYDLRTSISILILDGFEYKFPHRSLQEFFSAQFITSLPTEKKQKAYKNLNKALTKYSNDSSNNLWLLCKELDETQFTKLVIIPKLEYFYKQLSVKDGMPLLKKYLSLIHAAFYYDIRTGPIKVLRILRRLEFFVYLSDFLELYNYEEIWKFPEKSGADKELIPLMESLAPDQVKNIGSINKNFSAATMNPTDEEILNILLKYGITKHIKAHRNSIKNKISFFKNQISTESATIDEILDM